MKNYQVALIVFAAGALGGVVNALMSGNAFFLPRSDGGPPKEVILPGLLATMLLGGIAAVVSWGLYGTASGVPLDGQGTLTAAALAGALLVGFGGARSLTDEADKRLLNKAVALAAEQSGSAAQTKELLKASPKQALHLLRTR